MGARKQINIFVREVPDGARRKRGREIIQRSNDKDFPNLRKYMNI